MCTSIVSDYCGDYDDNNNDDDDGEDPSIDCGYALSCRQKLATHTALSNSTYSVTFKFSVDIL